MENYKTLKATMHKDFNGWTRVDKREARRAYEAGNPIMLTPSRVSPNEMLKHPSTTLAMLPFNEPFDELVDWYEGDFCYDIATTGNYALYYVQTAVYRKGAKS